MKLLQLWSDAKQKQWEATRQLGYKSFMLRTAVPWGVLMFITNGTYQWFAFASEKNTLEKFLLIHLVLWSLGAWMFGHGIWAFNERQYRKHLESSRCSKNSNNL